MSKNIHVLRSVIDSNNLLFQLIMITTSSTSVQSSDDTLNLASFRLAGGCLAMFYMKSTPIPAVIVTYE